MFPAFESGAGSLSCKSNERRQFSYNLWVRPVVSVCGSLLTLKNSPTLMGTGPIVADAGWQVRAIDTILQNTYQIFDDD